MKRFVLLASFSLILASSRASLFADDGSGSSGGGTSSTSTATVRAASERTIPGGTVQIKYFLSQPRPITFAVFDTASNGFSLDGVAASGPTADASGVAMSLNGHVRVALYSPDSSLGTDGYPVLALTLDVPALPVGTQLTAPLQAINVTGSSGAVVLDVSHPVTVTIGGSLSVSGVFPGGGTWPTGTVLSLRGSGFQPGTTVNAHLQATPAVFVSSNEFRLTLTHDQIIDRTLFEVTNPDGSQQKFYSYLRGTLIQSPSQALLQASEPIFSTVTHITGNMTVPPLLDSQFAAIAVQNPNPGPVSVLLTIPATGETASVNLPSQGRLVEDLSVLFHRHLNAAEIVSISGTSPVQMVGIFGDPAALIVSPILLSF